MTDPLQIIKKLLNNEFTETDTADLYQISSYLKNYQFSNEELECLCRDEQMRTVMETALRSNDSALAAKEVALEIMCQFFSLPVGSKWLSTNGQYLLKPIFKNLFDEKTLGGYEISIKFLCKFAGLQQQVLLEYIEAYSQGEMCSSSVLRLRFIELLTELLISVDLHQIEDLLARLVKLQFEDDDLVSRAGTITLFSKFTRIAQNDRAKTLGKINVLPKLIETVELAGKGDAIESTFLINCIDLLFQLTRTDQGRAIAYPKVDDGLVAIENIYNFYASECMEDKIVASLICAIGNYASTADGLETLLNRKKLLSIWLEYGHVFSIDLKKCFFTSLSLLYSSYLTTSVSPHVNELLRQLYQTINWPHSTPTMSFLSKTLQQSNSELNATVISFLQTLVHFQWGLVDFSNCQELVSWTLCRSKDTQNLQSKYDLLKSAFEHPKSKEILGDLYNKVRSYLRIGVYTIFAPDSVAVQTQNV